MIPKVTAEIVAEVRKLHGCGLNEAKVLAEASCLMVGCNRAVNLWDLQKVVEALIIRVYHIEGIK